MNIESHEKSECGPWSFDIDEAAKLLALFANRRRLQIMMRLSSGEWSVTPLSQEVGLRQSALSQYLGILRKAGLVKVRRSAQQMIYSSQSEAVAILLAALEEIYTHAPPKKQGPSEKDR